VVVAANVGPFPVLLGVDNTYVYYRANDPTQTNVVNAGRVSKTVVGGIGAVLDSGMSLSYWGVMGTKLFSMYKGSYSKCDISTPASCATSTGLLAGAGVLINFTSTAQQTYARFSFVSDLENAVTWYSSTNDTLVQTFTDSPYPSSPFNYQTPFAFGDSVYFVRQLADAGGTVTDSSLYSVSVSNPALRRLTDNMYPDVETFQVIDANTQSVLLSGPSGLYRVALPSGNPAAKPPLLTALADNISGATEDASGVYWLQGDGTLYGCSPSPDCAASKKYLASGLSPQPAEPRQLLQDTSALYWSNSASSQVMRLAK
jgi:hypothetical protein